MRNKYTAATLALLLGLLGVHRLYLGQYFRALLYLVYPIVTLTIVFSATGFLGVLKEQATLSISIELLRFLLLFHLIPVFDCIWFLATKRATFDQRYNQQKTKWARALPASLLILVIGAGFNYFVFQQFYVKGTVDVAGAPADVKMDAAGFASEFAENKDEAARQYKDKVIRLTGTVEAEETQLTESGDERILILKGAENLAIRCEFAQGQQDRVQQVKMGANVTVKGSFREVMVSDLVLEDCYLLENEN